MDKFKIQNISQMKFFILHLIRSLQKCYLLVTLPLAELIIFKCYFNDPQKFIQNWEKKALVSLPEIIFISKATWFWVCEVFSAGFLRQVKIHFLAPLKKIYPHMIKLWRTFI